MKTLRALFVVVFFFLPGASPRIFAQTPPTPPLPEGRILDVWLFQDTNWTSVLDTAPLAFTNLTLTPDWAGNGLLLDNTNASYLNYAIVETNGSTNINFANGSFEMWFAPDWNTSDGLGNWGTLLEAGTWNTNLATGAIGLYLTPDGSTILYSAQTNGYGTNYLAAPISWYAGDWHHIAVTYSATNSALYLEGQLVTNGPGINVLPPQSVLTNGFSVGSDGNTTGLLQARGIFNHLITYDFVLDATTISNDYAYDSQSVYPLPSSGGRFTLDSPPSPSGLGTNGGSGGGSPDYSQSYTSNQFWLQALPLGTNAYNANTNCLTLMLHGTVADTAYQILSTTNLPTDPTNWIVETNLIGSASTNFTVTAITMTGRPTLFFRAFANTLDSDGDGLPDWWELKYSTGSFPLSPTNADTGNTGIPDGYKQDSAGDGYNNLQKYQMGIAPNVFVSPPAPVNFTMNWNTNGNVTLAWSPAANLPGYGAGAVTGYTFNAGYSNINVSASATNYTLTTNNDLDVYDYPILAWFDPPPTISLQINFANANSLSSAPQAIANPDCDVISSIVRGPAGNLYLVASAIPTNVATIRVRVISLGCTYPIMADATFQWESYQYVYFTNIPPFDVPVASLSNGMFQIAASNVPPYGAYEFETQGIDFFGNLGPLNFCAVFQDQQDDFIPFWDGRTNIQQNINFLLRSATAAYPFSYQISGNYICAYSAAANYVYSGYYGYDQNGNFLCDEFLPFEDNVFYENWLYSTNNVSAGRQNTGLLGAINPYALYSDYGAPPSYLFPASSYLTNTTAPATSGVLTDSEAQWIYYPAGSLDNISDIGLNFAGPTQDNVSNSCLNIYGLRLSSILLPGSPATVNYPGNTFYYEETSYYFDFATPVLETVGYYFPRPGIDPQPGENSFTITNATASPLMIPFGQPFLISAWAKQAIANGYSGVFAYPQQYFDKAYLADTNGNITTNQTGILSEYGNFFPTQPGQVFLTTKPDGATGTTGTNAISVIKLQVDASGDGVMDPSFAGPDNPSANHPYKMWINNNYDRFTLDSDDGVYYDDDVQVAGDFFTPNTPVPDYDFKDGAGHRSISCERDLQDFTRLWLAGVTSNLVAALPTNSTVTLSWGDGGSPNSGNPTIDLFAAADADGGTGYLTNSATAAIQADNLLCPYIGRLGPGQSLQLNSSQFSNNWAGSYFIWCGVASGNGTLTLTIADGNGHTLVQTVTYIQIVDIKQMYERWTVGDAPGFGPLTNAIPAQEGVSQPFQYSPPTGTNTPYILYVHGWNMETWEKDRFAESAFKRLHWQGYQGRFGSFRWPTGYGFSGLSTLATNPDAKDNYDGSEYQAWLSGAGLLNTLTNLNALYPGQVYMLAHSMGNVVAGEALRLAGSTQVVNTYVASQAAISAHTYDTNVADYSFAYSYLGVSLSSHADTPNIYGNWFAGNNGGGAGQVISFYNTNDYALARNRWQLNQLLKPDQYVLESGNRWDYGYSGSTNDPSPWNHFYKQGPTGLNTVNFDIVTYLTNRYEVMAYDAQSWATALGATPVETLTRDIDLTTVWPTDTNPNFQNNPYSEHFYHSAEFRGDYWQQQGYWNELLGSEAFDLK